LAKRSKSKKLSSELQLGLFAPASDWTPPESLPDLSAAKAIGIDVESRDPYLNEEGPGFIRGDARVVGISLAVEDGPKMYLPFGHLDGGNMDKDKVVDYVKVQLSRPHQTKAGANLMYELEALDSLGIPIVGPLWDIQNAEPLLDEEKADGYSLEVLSRDYLGQGKTERLLREAADASGIDPKSEMWKLHSKYVGPYAEDDALNPILIMKQQHARLEKEKLLEVMKLESDLQPCLWKMRKRGVRIDLDAAEALSRDIQEQENQLIRMMKNQLGFFVDPWSPVSLRKVFEALGLEHAINKTAKGNDSFTNEYLLQLGEQYQELGPVLEFRQMNKMRRDFIEGLILAKNVNGRLHPNWHQLRTDDEDKQNGTKTGRIASSKVNLTQIPTRSPKWGKPIRRLFVADYGGRWCKLDYSQQEPRWSLHYAFIKNYPGAAEARRKYLENPDIDYHEMVQFMIRDMVGMDIGRGKAKGINLGSAYGMGKWKLAQQLGVDVEEATKLLKAYHQGVPYVKKLADYCMELAQANGFIRTYSGRKRRFNSWEPARWEDRDGYPMKDYEAAVDRWGNVTRALIHKAMNAKIQGSAADQIKMAIVEMDRQGILPHIQVYDEINTTIYDDETAFQMQKILETICPLEIPFSAKPDVGTSWGDVVELERVAA